MNRQLGAGQALTAALLVAAAALALVNLGAAGPSAGVTARLGISAGQAIADLPPGTAGPALATRIPVLFDTAARLGVEIETVSVGQGFYTEDGALQSERDLDLVVSGARDDITALGALLGRSWDQSLVFVWFVDPTGPLATATLPLPGGAQALTEPIYQHLVVELKDGGHVRYADSASLLFVANTGGEPEAAFFARMDRARALLDQAGLPTAPLVRGRAEQISLTREQYDQYLERRRLEPAA
jgi:hypothetical protein